MAVPGGPLNVVSLIRQWLSRLDTDWDIDNLLAQEPPPPALGFEQYKQGFAAPAGMPQSPNMANPAIASLMRTGA